LRDLGSQWYVWLSFFLNVITFFSIPLIGFRWPVWLAPLILIIALLAAFYRLYSKFYSEIKIECLEEDHKFKPMLAAQSISQAYLTNIRCVIKSVNNDTGIIKNLSISLISLNDINTLDPDSKFIFDKLNIDVKFTELLAGEPIDYWFDEAYHKKTFRFMPATYRSKMEPENCFFQVMVQFKDITPSLIEQATRWLKFIKFNLKYDIYQMNADITRNLDITIPFKIQVI